jgi:hypothetical protein
VAEENRTPQQDGMIGFVDISIPKHFPYGWDQSKN